jgi:hypothetical protein
MAKDDLEEIGAIDKRRPLLSRVLEQAVIAVFTGAIASYVAIERLQVRFDTFVRMQDETARRIEIMQREIVSQAVAIASIQERASGDVRQHAQIADRISEAVKRLDDTAKRQDDLLREVLRQNADNTSARRAR